MGKGEINCWEREISRSEMCNWERKIVRCEIGIGTGKSTDREKINWEWEIR
jgi:hypothetical protein